MKLPLYRGGSAAGTVEVLTEGNRAVLRAAMEDPGDGLYRAVLLGTRGELAVGVMAPEGKNLAAERCVYRRDVEQLGESAGGEARRFRAFGKAWLPAQTPEALLRDPFLSRRLGCCRRVWYRREGGVLQLAAAAEEGEPFPLETLFCLAEPGLVEGVACMVFRFDEMGRPLLPEKE